MPAEKFITGPISYPVYANVTINTLVEAHAGGVQPAAALSTKVLGVAMESAIATAIANPGTFNGFQTYDFAGQNTIVAVSYNCVARLTYAANANFGDLLVAAANGQVTPAGGTPAVGTVVGKCIAVAGVVSGAVGDTLIRV